MGTIIGVCERAATKAWRRFYDAFTAASDYESWTAHVLALAESWLGREAVLDVACGTGKSFCPSCGAASR